ncbi:hypothetical protein GQ600_5535 [Phytophthora cactorum]|nr:hypothetical protein GQ600_5535 [Phytophthora cactorum]
MPLSSRMVSPRRGTVQPLFVPHSWPGAGRDDFVADLTDYMATLEDLEGLIDATYLDSIRHGKHTRESLSSMRLSKLHNWNTEVKTVNADYKVVSTFIYSVEELTRWCSLHAAGHSFCQGI